GKLSTTMNQSATCIAAFRARKLFTSALGSRFIALSLVAHAKDQARPAERAQPTTKRASSRSGLYRNRPYSIRREPVAGSDSTPKVSIIANIAWTPTATPSSIEATNERCRSPGVPDVGEVVSIAGVLVLLKGWATDPIRGRPDTVHQTRYHCQRR